MGEINRSGVKIGGFSLNSTTIYPAPNLIYFQPHTNPHDTSLPLVTPQP